MFLFTSASCIHIFSFNNYNDNMLFYDDDFAMDERENMTDCIQKVQTFVACLRHSSWIKQAKPDDIDLLCDTAIELSELLKSAKSFQLQEKLRLLYPKIDLDASQESILILLLKTPSSNPKTVLYTINKYINEHSKEKFKKLLQTLIVSEKLKNELINLCFKFQHLNKRPEFFENVGILMSLEESETGSESSTLESFVKCMLEKRPTEFLTLVTSLNTCRAAKIVNILTNYLKLQKDLKQWLILMNERNIDNFLILCENHICLREEVFKLFDNYSLDVKLKYDDDFKIEWQHKELDFSTFVFICKKFASSDKAVRTFFENYVDEKLQNFDNFSFWIDVKSELDL